MKEKKNIDQLFNERFQNFEATPDPAVWKNIEAKLQDKKKDRKVIPLWWRVTGVAALLALLLTVGISLYNNPESPSQQLVEGDVVPAKNTTIETPEDISTEKPTRNDAVVTEETNADTPGETNPSKRVQQQTENGVAETSVVETTTKDSEKIQHRNNRLEQPQPRKISNKPNTTSKAVTVTKDANKPTSNSSETTQNPLVKDLNTVVSEKEVATVQAEKSNQKTAVKDEGLFKENAIVPSSENDAAVTQIKKEENQDAKPSIFDAIKENEAVEKQAINKKENAANRWAVSPNVGPVYYGSLSNGSSIDPMFADNAQSGEVNLSYGVQVAYDISKKISIRSGVNNVNLSYATGDVQVASAPPEFGLRGVNYDSNRSSVTTVFDVGASDLNPSSEGFDNITLKNTGGNAEISQRINYYEVPLELNYAVLENRFGINIIGGMSTLFLGNNEIVVSDGDFRTVLGEANNLNSISFTTNIGLGFNYQLSKRFKFNIEPMFKYQLNPYTDSSINFKPYYMGVYSGLSFKF